MSRYIEGQTPDVEDGTKASDIRLPLELHQAIIDELHDISKILTCLNCLNYVLSDLSVYRSFSPFRLNFSNIL